MHPPYMLGNDIFLYNVYKTVLLKQRLAAPLAYMWIVCTTYKSGAYFKFDQWWFVSAHFLNIYYASEVWANIFTNCVTNLLTYIADLSLLHQWKMSRQSTTHQEDQVIILVSIETTGNHVISITNTYAWPQPVPIYNFQKTAHGGRTSNALERTA